MKQDQPFFSIVIPTFNSSGKVGIALKSVLDQEFRNFEICIVDGGSSDDTLACIEAVINSDPRVRVISEKDDGIYDAMNKGIRMSKGQWLYFLGSDDRLNDPSVLTQVWQTLENTKDLFLYGNVWMNGRIYDGKFTLEKLLSKNISHQGIFYSVSLFDKLGYYNTSFQLHADWDFNIRCFLSLQTGIRFSEIVVAKFGAGGVSAAHDVPFLRQTLVPLKLASFQNGHIGLRNIKLFDEWWRLIRNAKLWHSRDWDSTNDTPELPGLFLSIMKFQSLLPKRLLSFGPASKALMLVCYLTSGAIFGRK